MSISERAKIKRRNSHRRQEGEQVAIIFSTKSMTMMGAALTLSRTSPSWTSSKNAALRRRRSRMSLFRSNLTSSRRKKQISANPG
jgi:hypothetical protein